LFFAWSFSLLPLSLCFSMIFIQFIEVYDLGTPLFYPPQSALARVNTYDMNKYWKPWCSDSKADRWYYFICWWYGYQVRDWLQWSWCFSACGVILILFCSSCSLRIQWGYCWIWNRSQIQCGIIWIYRLEIPCMSCF
jgi:hypothetical protein